MMRRIFSKETLLALVLAGMLILLIIATTDTSPAWIYQGF